MKILLLRTWLSNIGNGFIDKGAKICVKRAFPNSEIYDISGHLRHVADNYIYDDNKKIIKKIFNSSRKGIEKYTDWQKNKLLDITQFCNYDLVIFPGCVLYEHPLRKYLDVLRKINNLDIPIIFLGAGGMDYSKETVSNVKKLLRKIDSKGLITRDSEAFEKYSNLFRFSYDGIDNGFFIDEWYKPLKTKEDFIVFNFDKINEPNIKSDNNIIRTDHNPFSYLSEGYITSIFKNLFGQTEIKKLENRFLSDDIKDYLFLYSNCKETHSDRIHACVPTLVYGNKAKFYYDTPREGLFKKFKSLDEIKERPTSLDRRELEKQKKKQIKTLQEFCEEIIK